MIKTAISRLTLPARRKGELSVQRKAGMLLEQCATKSVNLLYLPLDARMVAGDLFHGGAVENKKSG